MDGLISSNLTHHPGRTAASIAGVAVGVVLVVLTVGLVRGTMRERAQRDANVGAEIMVSRQGQGVSFTSADMSLAVEKVAQVRALPGVAVATPVGQNLEMKGETGLGLRQIEGIEFDDFAAVAKLRIVEGQPLPASGDVAVVDPRYMADHKARLGDKISALDREFTIVGVYEPEVGSRIKIPLSAMQAALGREGMASMIYVKCQSPELQEGVARQILERFPDDRVIFTRDLPELFATGFAAVNVFLRVVAGLAAVISMLVILLTMYTTVAERTRQIGILKSLGASKLFIAGAVEKEALLISALGVALGLAFALLLRALLVGQLGWKIELEPNYMILASLAGVASGAVGALYPALRAASQDPVEALSYE